jgi:hypothetical protein
VAMPDELASNLDQFELVVIHLRHHFRHPVLRELSQLFAKVNGRVFQMVPPENQK